MSVAPATGTPPVVAPASTPVPAPVPLLAMRGSADAAACEGDACLVPGAAAVAAPDATRSAAPTDADPAADLARVRDAIDSGRAI